MPPVQPNNPSGNIFTSMFRAATNRVVRIVTAPIRASEHLGEVTGEFLYPGTASPDVRREIDGSRRVTRIITDLFQESSDRRY